MGYQRSTSGAITVTPADRVRVELLMSADAVVLAPLTVVASSRNVGRGSRMAAFEWRREHNPWGRFIGPDRIARIRPFYATDVLMQVPFVHVTGNGVSRQPTLRGRFGDRCTPTVYVDGHQAYVGSDLTVDEVVSGTDIAAVEVYDRPFKAPPEFAPNTLQLDCGVIVIWTRMAERHGG